VTDAHAHGRLRESGFSPDALASRAQETTMFNTPKCRVTAKDFTILANMITQTPPYDDRLLRLLRRKLSMAVVVPPEGVDPDLATLNSRLEYRIDGGRSEACVLVHDTCSASPGLALPISTIRGLSLLGPSVGDSIPIERADGRIETISLERVAYQPESATGTNRLAPSSQNGATLVNLRQYATSRARGGHGHTGLEDDERGPPAA
jgi:regulator of nucleoside diphosphate kinase